MNPKPIEYGSKNHGTEYHQHNKEEYVLMTINNIKGKCRILFFKGNKKIDNKIGILIPRTPGMGTLDSLFNNIFFFSNYDS